MLAILFVYQCLLFTGGYDLDMVPVRDMSSRNVTPDSGWDDDDDEELDLGLGKYLIIEPLGLSAAIKTRLSTVYACIFNGNKIKLVVHFMSIGQRWLEGLDCRYNKFV